MVINDLERLGSSELQAVLDFHRSGGGLFMVLGGRADPAFWNSTLLRELGAGEVGAINVTISASLFVKTTESDAVAE